ncbi:hypothetical protein [uncultured Alistipes sp.]|jgi:hypothetical protein|uniref:hypothetical protein n=1 Tax=uncultured Alistipes sp. TaxID=538949 RepID=UPI0025CC4C54|nr:hypothetical protein [uncultured Alistipes sp.]
MNLRSISRRLRISTVLFTTVAAAGCVKEQDTEIPPAPGTGSGEVTVTVHIPGAQAPVSRSISGAGEAAVASADLLVFGKEGADEVLLEHARGNSIDQSGSSAANGYQVQFRAKIQVNTAATTVVVIANASTQVSDMVNADGINSAYGSSKATVLASLSYASGNAGGTAEGWKWNVNAADKENPKPGADYAPIPMYGEYDVTENGSNSNGITDGMQMTGIDLIRMLVCIDVTNSAKGFTLEKISLVNYNTAGYLAPAWNLTTGMLLKSGDTDYPYDTNGAPRIPASANKQTGEAMALHYAYPAAGGLMGSIYTYEAAATTGIEGTQGHTEAACLILEGTLDGSKYFYRVDFTDSKDAAGKIPGQGGFDPTRVSYIPLYRNYRYAFEIKRVDGPGYGSFDQALRSLGLGNNMRTDLLVIDDGVKELVFNENHFLGTGGEVAIGPGTGATGVTTVATNYAYGWQIDKAKGQDGIEYGSGGTGWLGTEKAGSDTDRKSNLRLTASSSNIGSQARTAWVHLRAGTLTHKLKVTQDYGIITVSPYSVTMPVSVTANSAHSVHVRCTDSKGNPASIEWSLETGDPWLTFSDDPSGTGKSAVHSNRGPGTLYLFADEFQGTGSRYTFIYLNGRDPDNITVDVKQLGRFTGAGTPVGPRTYVGAFWRGEQTGERLIRIYDIPAGAAGDWSVSVLDYGDFLHDEIFFSTDPSTDPDIGTDNAADMYTHDAVYRVGGENIYIAGTAQTGGQIFFRIGLKSRWDRTNLRYIAMGRPARYATIVISYNNHTKVQKLYLRQGHEADYLMRKGDKNGSGANITGNRDYARPFQPYNLTHRDMRKGATPGSLGGPNVTNHPGMPVRDAMLDGFAIVDDYFTRYPTQAGAFFQWANANQPRRAYHPVNAPTALTGWANNHPSTYWNTLGGNHETCPPGYRRPTDGSVSGANTAGAIGSSEMRQSLWLNPQTGNQRNSPDNSVWGYYADGFFDRRPIRDAKGNLPGTNCVVSGTTADAAYQGRLFFNPATQASLFFPAPGYRNHTSGRLESVGNGGCYWSSSAYDASGGWYSGMTSGAASQNYTNRPNGFSVRCIKE